MTDLPMTIDECQLEIAQLCALLASATTPDMVAEFLRQLIEDLDDLPVIEVN